MLVKIYFDINSDNKKITKLKIVKITKTNKKFVEFNLIKFISSKKNFFEALVKAKERIWAINVPKRVNNAIFAKSLGDKNLVKIGRENNAINKDETFEIK